MIAGSISTKEDVMAPKKAKASKGSKGLRKAKSMKPIKPLIGGLGLSAGKAH